MSSGIFACASAWSNCATAMRYSGVSHSSGASRTASGGLATARRVYPRSRAESASVTARDPLDVEAYAAELAKVVIGELKPISQPIEIRDYDPDWPRL